MTFSNLRWFIFVCCLVHAICYVYDAAATETLRTNPLVTQETLKTTVCSGNSGAWIKTQRPPVSYTQAWEQVNGGDMTTIVDHAIPLCAGGHPLNTDNLILQDTAASYSKDVTERTACRLLCKGTLTLKEAQSFFSGY